MKLIIILVHISVCVALILIVLLQRGKGSDMGAAFGGSSQAIFGSRGATTFLHKITAAIAIIFMLTSLLLAYLSTQRTGGDSIMNKAAAPVEQPAPAAPSGARARRRA